MDLVGSSGCFRKAEIPVLVALHSSLETLKRSSGLWLDLVPFGGRTEVPVYLLTVRWRLMFVPRSYVPSLAFHGLWSSNDGLSPSHTFNLSAVSSCPISLTSSKELSLHLGAHVMRLGQPR